MLREFRAYWWKVVQRAWSDTVTLLDARKKWLVALVIAALAFEFLRHTRGNPAAFQQLDWFASRAAVFVVVAIAAFLVMVFFVSPYRLDRDAETRIRGAQANFDALTNRLLPRLEIVFDPQCASCQWDQGNRWRWLRIGITNPGGETIRNAEILLARFEAPYGDVGLQLPSALRWMDDQRPGQGSLDLNPTGEGHRHVDLVAHRSLNLFLQINFARGAQEQVVNQGGFGISLRATGEDIQPVVAHFLLIFEENERLTLQSTAHAERPPARE